MAGKQTLSQGGAEEQMVRNGGAPRRPTLTPSTVRSTCTEASTVQESMWNHSNRRQPCRSAPPLVHQLLHALSQLAVNMNTTTQHSIPSWLLLLLPPPPLGLLQMLFHSLIHMNQAATTFSTTMCWILGHTLRVIKMAGRPCRFVLNCQNSTVVSSCQFESLQNIWSLIEHSKDIELS